MTATAYLFPGQGSHVPGMRDEVARLRPDLLDAVCAAAGDDPFARIAEGTRWAQPAILCAALARWSATDVTPDAVAGHSLGELGALVAAGALDELDALVLVAERARAMDAAGGGGMLALVGGELGAATALAADHGVVVANDNAPGQVVLSGSRDALAAVEAGARDAGFRAIPLDVSGAFHSPAMAPAREAFAAAVGRVTFQPPQVPVISGVTAAPVDDPARRLVEALTAPVRFREALLALRERGIERFVEVGPGKVLAGLARRTLRGADVQALAVAEAVGA